MEYILHVFVDKSQETMRAMAGFIHSSTSIFTALGAKDANTDDRLGRPFGLVRRMFFIVVPLFLVSSRMKLLNSLELEVDSETQILYTPPCQGG